MIGAERGFHVLERRGRGGSGVNEFPLGAKRSGERGMGETDTAGSSVDTTARAPGVDSGAGADPDDSVAQNIQPGHASEIFRVAGDQ
ncbi:MAG: hypothetical protein ACREDF_02370, partial [Thermoplasmata archaeon]